MTLDQTTGRRLWINNGALAGQRRIVSFSGGRIRLLPSARLTADSSRRRVV